MGKSRWHWVWLAAIVGFLAVGILFWQIPYSKVNLPDAMLGFGLIVVATSALLLRASGVARTWRAIWTMGLVPAAADMARVIVECMRDPTAHNLWPLEIAIALGLGFICSAAGTLVGGAMRFFVPVRRAR